MPQPLAAAAAETPAVPVRTDVTGGRIVLAFIALVALYGVVYLIGPPNLTDKQCRVSEVTATTVKCKLADKDAKPLSLKAADEDDKKRLATLKPGAILEVSQFAALPAARVAELAEIKTTPDLRALLFAFAGTLLFLWVSAGCTTKVFSALLLGADNRLSNSKVQTTLWLVPTLWFWHYIVMARYAAGMAWTDALSVTISTDLLALAGLSAATAAAAKVVAPAVKTVPASAEADWRLAFLFCDDKGKLDPADTQMIIVTLISVASFIVPSLAMVASLKLTGQAELAAPPELMKFLLGGSLSAYLVPKLSALAGKPKAPDAAG